MTARDSDSTPWTTRRRPIRVQGYKIYSDDDSLPDDEGDQHFTESKPMFDDDDSLICNDDMFMDLDNNETVDLSTPHKHASIQSWIAFSLLPRYTEKVEVPPSLSRLERILASFTMYNQFKEANMDSHFELVFARLQMEWTCYMGGLLVALAAVDTAVFSIAPGSLFTVESGRYICKKCNCYQQHCIWSWDHM